MLEQVKYNSFNPMCFGLWSLCNMRPRTSLKIDRLVKSYAVFSGLFNFCVVVVGISYCVCITILIADFLFFF